MSFNFETDVLALSYKVPVLVDFWAPWCGPCQVLGPVLEELEKESNGRWQLVKINTEEHQDLATEYQIQSIPNVKLFHRGVAVEEFMGALPKSAIQKWLSEHLPNENKAQLEELIAQLNPINAQGEKLASLLSFCESHPEMEYGNVMAGVFLSYQNPEQAISIVQSIKMGSKYFEIAQDVKTLANWMMNVNENSENPLDKAAILLKKYYFRESLELLVDSLILVDEVNKEEIRRIGVALFRLFDSYFDWIRPLRKRFDMYLY